MIHIVEDKDTQKKIGFIGFYEYDSKKIFDDFHSWTMKNDKKRIENTKKKKAIFVEVLGVFPGEQHKGYGSTIFQFLKEKFSPKNHIFLLHSGSSDCASESKSCSRQSEFYKKCGFIEYPYKLQEKYHSWKGFNSKYKVPISLYVYDKDE